MRTLIPKHGLPHPRMGLWGTPVHKEVSLPQPLLHRERDLAHLAAALDGARDGRPSVVLIRGVRGIGKTALMRAGLNKGPMDAMVLRAQCSAAESSFDLAVVHQLFDPVL